MRAGRARRRRCRGDGPAIVCAQAGNVNTGAFDPFEAIVAACRDAGAWCHVDGAFGLWAAAAPGRAHLSRASAGADSWAVDAHKWLNVPYDSALAIVADPAPLDRRDGAHGAYLTTAGAARAQRRRLGAGGLAARARVPALAALRQLGRNGVAELVERHCALAARIAERLAAGRASRSSTTSCSTRCSCASATTTRRRTP